LASNFSLPNVVRTQPNSYCVVGSVHKNYMNECHTNDEGYDGQKHNPIVSGHFFRSNILPTDAEQNYRDGITGTPPAHKECRFILMEVSLLRRRTHEAANYVHLCYVEIEMGRT
jgi:hypothetical protein